MSPQGGDLLTRTTACPLDCPDTCSLTVTITTGRLTAVDATPVKSAENPTTGGFICQKVKHHADRVYGPDRVLTPLIRNGTKGSGLFRPATWDEAMAIVAGQIRKAISQHGRGSVVPLLYNSSAGVVAASYGHRVCAELGIAKVDNTICAATATAANAQVMGGLISADPLDLAHAKFVVVWGANPTISNTHLPPIITQACRAGAKLVVVDPRRTAIAARADVHLAVRPGTDVVLAAAMARHLAHSGLLDSAFIDAHVVGADGFLEACDQWTPDRAEAITGVASSLICSVAEQWATTRPAMLRIGWGMERNYNGGPGLMSVYALPALMGHFGTRGAGVLTSTGSSLGLDTNRISRPPLSSEQASTDAAPRRTVSHNDLGLVLNADHPSEKVGVLIVQGANPALMNMDQQSVVHGLVRDDLFTVVHEQMMTDTARYADVVLPATTHFEAGDIASSYGSMLTQRFDAVIERVGESRTNAEFFHELGTRLGLDLTVEPEALVDEVGGERPHGTPRAPGTSVQFVDSFPTRADRKLHLFPPVYVPLDVPTGRLRLLSPSNAKTINSIFGEAHGAPSIHIHPVDAADLGIVDGHLVRVWNEGGSIEVTAAVGDDTQPGVVVIPKGFWARSFSSDGTALNALIPRTIEPLAGGACFNDATVFVEPVA